MMKSRVSEPAWRKRYHIEEWSAISYPNELHLYVTREFQRVKQRQADLLGIKDGIRSKL